jgi:hypothetical protein
MVPKGTKMVPQGTKNGDPQSNIWLRIEAAGPVNKYLIMDHPKGKESELRENGTNYCHSLIMDTPYIFPIQAFPGMGHGLLRCRYGNKIYKQILY